MPSGGTANQVLAKNTATNYDIAWATLNAASVGLGSVTNDAQTQAAVMPNTAPAAGAFPIGNVGGTAYVPRTLTNMSVTASGVVTGITNTALSNSAITIAGTSVSLGGSIALGPSKVTWYTTAGANTHTTATGARSIYVEMVGGGGGGGGALGAASAPTSCAAGGGGGGGWSCKLITGTLQSTYACVVGAGGAGGTATPANGTTGGDTTWQATVIVAKGGVGGTLHSTPATPPITGAGGGLGGAVGTGDASGAGGTGGFGIVLAGAATGSLAGYGGNSIWGGSSGGNARTGTAGKAYGGGGMGACSVNATGVAGGAGADGAIKVTEYF